MTSMPFSPTLTTLWGTPTRFAGRYRVLAEGDHPDLTYGEYWKKYGTLSSYFSVALQHGVEEEHRLSLVRRVPLHPPDGPATEPLDEVERHPVGEEDVLVVYVRVQRVGGDAHVLVELREVLHHAPRAHDGVLGSLRGDLAQFHPGGLGLPRHAPQARVGQAVVVVPAPDVAVISGAPHLRDARVVVEQRGPERLASVVERHEVHGARDAGGEVGVGPV
eukprot:CAMPEP_0172533620 /NCGR_PEP_ID=MMETSP1067-20121228/6256_1 /TAXON_ID=265564 ORGANISM="Thalassiosira punctigera, Strain Tpunct2005C2" /NCGR_SAMPLE_ID=MMETSP1067 /ASSEMBLY_ACC=CAM_ASM_000444 /LENGTH=218 /DNA_ID=CAMNT_0013318283 /DNA_START=129 /DNA_END=781 /DNA_ORIENTATION=+